MGCATWAGTLSRRVGLLAGRGHVKGRTRCWSLPGHVVCVRVRMRVCGEQQRRSIGRGQPCWGRNRTEPYVQEGELGKGRRWLSQGGRQGRRAAWCWWWGGGVVHGGGDGARRRVEEKQEQEQRRSSSRSRRRSERVGRRERRTDTGPLQSPGPISTLQPAAMARL